MQNKVFVVSPSSSRLRAALALAATTLIALVLAQPASAALGDLSLVSRTDGVNGVAADDTTWTEVRSTSSDGRYVILISESDNLGGFILAAPRQIYRRDTLLGSTILVSRANGVAGAAGDDGSFAATVSNDGNLVAFASNADNLSASDNNAHSNIFVRDIAAGTTTLVSRGSNEVPYNNAAANNSSLRPVISGDGTHVAFNSAASNLDPTITDNNATVDAYIRVLGTQITRLLSRSSGGTLGNGFSGVGDISDDARYVTVDSAANNLGGTVDGSGEVYLRDRTNGTMELISQPDGATAVGGNDSDGGSTITSNGDRVAWIGRSTNLVSGVPANRYLGYLRDRAAQTTRVVTRANNGELANDDVQEFTMSVDGQLFAYTTESSNLDGPGSANRQAFTTDLSNGLTQLVSRVGSAGDMANNSAYDVTFGRTASTAYFNTPASNLSPEATNGKSQVFARDARPPLPPSPVLSLSGKRFTAKVARSRFAVNVTTTGGATAISGTATIKVSKKLVRSGRLVVKYKLRAVPATSSSHKLTFKLSKKQNRIVRRALRSKRSRLRVSMALVASNATDRATGRFSGKLRR